MVNKSRSKRGKGPKRIAYNDNDTTEIQTNDIKFEYANVDNLKDAFVEAMEEIKSVNLENKQIQNIILKNRILFTTLIMLGLYAYYQPSYISGMSEEDTKIFKTEKAKELLTQGMSFDDVSLMIDSYVKEVTQTRFVFGNGKPMTAEQILEYLVTVPVLNNLIISLKETYLSLNKTASNVSEIFNVVKLMLSSFQEGKLDISNMGKMISYGMWTIILVSSYKFASFVTNIGSKVNERITQGMESTERILGLKNKKMRIDDNNVLVEMEGRKKVLSFNDIINTINSDKSPIIVSYFDWFLCKLFEHQEAWTVDDGSESLSSKSIDSIYSELSNKSLSSLESASSYGYGGDYDRMVDFIVENFGSKIEDAKIITINGFSNLYISLLKGYNYKSEEKQEETQSNTQEDQFSTVISEITNTTGMMTLHDERIETLTENAVKNTIRRSKYKRGGKSRKNRKTKKYNSKKTRKMRKGKKTMKKSYYKK